MTWKTNAHCPDLIDLEVYFYMADEQRKLGIEIQPPHPIPERTDRKWTKREMDDMVRNREVAEFIYTKMVVWVRDQKAVDNDLAGTI